MKRITAITLILLVSVLLAMTAFAGWHGHRKDKRMDNTNQKDLIYATSAGEGDILDMLRENHDVLTVDDGILPPYILGHVVVTADDLDNRVVSSLLKEAYAVGRTVAILDATKDEADHFQHLFGIATPANCEPADDSQRIPLYGLQKSIIRRPQLISSYCLAGITDFNNLGYYGWQPRLNLKRWLQDRFAATAPEPSVAEVTDDSDNIVDLATATNCSYNTTDDPANLGRQLQIDSYVTSARSFVSDKDIYYVENKLLYYQGTSSNPNYAYAVLRVGATGLAQFSSGVSDSQPSSVGAYTSSVTNQTITSISGSVGFNAQGPTGTIGGSVSHGKTVALSIPPILISNNTSSSPPLPQWTFQRQSLNSSDNNQSFQPETSWFWTIPKTSYGEDQGTGYNDALSFRAFVSMGGTFDQPESGDFAMTVTCNVAYPFGGLWEDAVGTPEITSVSSDTVAVGSTFTITGKELYPGLITAVLIDGTAIDMQDVTPKGQVSPGSDQFTVDVLVPDGTPTRSAVSVVVRTTFNDIPADSNAEYVTFTK